MKKALCCLHCLGALLGYASLQAQSPQDTYELGVRSFQAGEKTEAEKYFTQAAMIWEEPQGGNFDLFNAGTARALAGDYRDAVWDLRRFLENNPFSWEASENLAKVRKDAGLIDPGWSVSLKAPILNGLSLALSVLTGIFFIRWGLLLRSGKLGWKTILNGLVTLGLLAGLSVLFFTVSPEIRVAGSELLPRKGDGEYYEPVVSAPWKPGQEVIVSEERSGWRKVRVGNQEGWVPESLLIPREM